MVSNPICKLFFSKLASCKFQYFGHDLRIGGIEVTSVDSKKRYDGKKSDSFVAITIRVTRHKTEAVSSSHNVAVSLLPIDPFVAGARQRCLQSILVAYSRQAAVFLELFDVNGISDQPAQPSRLFTARLFTARRHGLLCEFAKGGTVFFCGLCRGFQSLLGFRVVRGEEDSLVGFESQDAIAGFAILRK